MGDSSRSKTEYSRRTYVSGRSRGSASRHRQNKIGVPDSILKKQGPLTSEERALINRHPEYSWSILRLFPGLEDASLYALHHHENFDGTGYPAGLKGEDIPIVSRIVSVIDATTQWFQTAATEKGFLTPKRFAACWKVVELSSTLRLYTHSSPLQSKKLPKCSPQPESVPAPRFRSRRKLGETVVVLLGLPAGHDHRANSRVWNTLPE